MNEETIFTAALAMPVPAERAEYLNAACAGDPHLRVRIEALLESFAQAGDFLSRPAFPAGGSQQSEADEQRSGVRGREFADVRFLASGSWSPTSDFGAPPGAGSDAEWSEAVGRRIGRYQLQRKLGEGGMGIVWVAQQCEPVEREVALKVIKPGMDTRKVIARMQAERQALALMDHTSIAKVLDGGATAAGRPYFVMELVQGTAITRFCDEARLPLRARLELFRTVCHAIQHAHQKGIIHRDIKPSNVLVALEDGKPVPKVIDFGVAKALHQPLTDQSLFTEAGQIVGTLEYMSPEQAKLNGDDIDTRADIYALGVLLYELLTGTTPLDRKRLHSVAYPEMVRLIREEEPVTPSMRLAQSPESLERAAALHQTEPKRLQRQLRGDLDWIVLKCLEKDRARRYETAAAIARDIERYLNDEPVEACPPSTVYRLRKFLRKHAVAAWSAAAFVALLVGGVVVSTTQAVRATRAEGSIREESGKVKSERDRAREAEKKADNLRKLADAARIEEVAQREAAQKHERLARRRLYASQMQLATQAWQTGQLARTLDLLEEQRPHFDEEDLRTFEWYWLWQRCHPNHRGSLRAARGQIMTLAFSPDGKSLAAAGWDGVRLWDVADLSQGTEPLKTLGYGNIWALAFAPDGATLVTAGTATDPDKSIRHHDLATGQEIVTHQGYTSAARAVAFSPDGSQLATGGAVGVTLWDPRSGRERLKFLTGKSVRTLAYTPDGKTLAVAGDAGVVHICSHENDTWREKLLLKGHSDWIRSIAISPDGTLLASGAREVIIWDIHSGERLTTLQQGTGLLWNVKFAPNGKILATAGEDRYVHLYDVGTWKERARLPHRAPLSALAFSRDGALLAAADYDGAVDFWAMEAEQGRDILLHGGRVDTILFAPDAKTLISAGQGPAKFWDPGTGLEQSAPASMTGFPVLSPDKTMFACTEGKTVTLRDARTGEQLGTLPCPGPVGRAAFAPDGKTLLAYKPAAHTHLVHVWDMASRKLRMTITPQPGHDVHAVASAAFSPDGKTLALGYEFWWVLLYDVASGRLKGELTQDRASLVSVSALAYSPNGKLLAAGTQTGTVRLWDTHASQVKAVLNGHTQAIRSLAFTPDGKTIASASDDATVRLWDALTGQERVTLTGHTGPVHVVVFDAAGRLMLTGGADGMVKLWRGAIDREAEAPRTDLDPEDPQSAAGLHRAGEQLRKAGRLRDAITAYRKADARFERLATAFPTAPDYRDFQAESCASLAAALEAQGNLQQAIATLGAVIVRLERRRGKEHSSLASPMAQLGWTLMKMRKFAQAEAPLHTCWTIRTRTQPETWRTHFSAYALGRCLLGQKRFAEAEPLLLAGYEGMARRKHLAMGSAPHVREALKQLMDLYEAWGKPKKAAPWRALQRI